MSSERLIESNPAMVVSLEEAARLPASEVGAKAANLSKLREAGFPVPDGFVLTAAGFGRFVDTHRFDADTPPSAVLAADLHDGLTAELHHALELLDGPVAVRSSGVAEDLEGASYAGQYESVLGANDLAAVEEAVKRCWASAFGEHLLLYHQAQGNHDVPGMAVLIQQMVPADAAGVAFSANPVTGDRDEIVINAVSGLGARLAAGETDGEHWSVRSGAAVRSDGGVEALRVDQVLRVSGLAGDVARHFGAPQDIEWAIATDVVHLLQARPITTLPEPQVAIPVEVPPGYWEREASHFPQPLSPLASSLTFETFNPALRQVMMDFGILVEGLEVTEIGGWVYMRLVPLGGKDRPTPPAWLMPVLIRVMPAMRSRIRQATEVVRSQKAGTMVDRWYQEWQPELADRISSLRSVDLSALQDGELATHWDAAVGLIMDGVRVHFTLHAAVCVPLAEFAFASSELLGWEDNKVWALLAGLSGMSTEASRGLGSLAELAASRPETRRIVEEGDGDALERLRDLDPGFATAFASYMREYGTRGLAYDPVAPSLAEEPLVALGLIADQLVRGFDSAAGVARLTRTREAGMAEARAALTSKAPTDQDRWERALARAERAYPIREDNVFYTISAPVALIRYAAIEVGRRLMERSQIDSEMDVFFLRSDEYGEALRDGRRRTDLVATRRAQRAWAESNPGPASYGKDPGPPPSLDALPTEARFVNQALLWYTERIFGSHPSERDKGGGQVIGIAASPGRYQGPVRIVRDESEFAKIRAGDVLVCPATSPVWSVVFPSIGALVTDTGGVLSHPAIIAREYGIPAVVATAIATSTLRDGQMVTVDGTAGSVEAG